MHWVNLILLSLISNLESARILGIFSTPSFSHQVVYHALVKDLAARGHHLTILTTDVMKIENSNVTQIDLHDAYNLCPETSFVKLKKDERPVGETFHNFLSFTCKVFDQQLSHPEVKRLIEKKDNQTFDVLIVELLVFNPMLVFAEVYDCPIIGISSCDVSSSTYAMFGNEINPAIHPDIIFTYLHGQLTFGERWKSLKHNLNFFPSLQYIATVADQIIHHFPKNENELNLENFLAKRFSLLLLNTHPALDNIRPLLPNTIQLGFLHIEPPKPLANGAVKNFLDESKNGVIYISFGSNVKSNYLPPSVLSIFLDVFRNLDYDILWKFESDDLAHLPKNVMISKWLPQSDLLAHPALKLFITQGGQQSIEEAIDRTIPMIVIPFLYDQRSNAKKIADKGFAHHLEFDSLSQEVLLRTIKEMLAPKYKENIRKFKELVNDQPMTSREKAIWWTEYVIRHKGAEHLNYPGRLVPFYQKYFLDFIFISLVLIVVTLKILAISTRKLKYFCKRKTE